MAKQSFDTKPRHPGTKGAVWTERTRPISWYNAGVVQIRPRTTAGHRPSQRFVAPAHYVVNRNKTKQERNEKDNWRKKE